MTNQLELRVEQQVGLLNWNFDEINRQIDAQILKYDGLVIQEDQIKEAKDLRADMNNLKGAIEDRRKEAKKTFCEPYDKFAEQVKIVVSKIDKVSMNIDSQIKDFENREKEEKRKKIEAWWNTECVTVPAISFERVFDKKFLNKTCKESEWKKILKEKHKQITSDLEAISNTEPKQKRDYVISEYMKSTNLSDALGKWEVYAEQLRIAEEFNRKAEEKRQELERRNTAQKQQITSGRESDKQIPIPEPITGSTVVYPEDTTYTRIIQVEGTKPQLVALANFMNAQGIKFKTAQ